MPAKRNIGKTKRTHSHKTAKRLATKYAMLAAKKKKKKKKNKRHQ